MLDTCRAMREGESHDVINRFLDNEKYTPSLLWEHIRDDVELSENGYVVFDDTVLEKRNTKKIEVARSQYSGARGGITTGIGVVSLVYYNPDVDKFWAIDYRIFAPDHDGASKIDHLLHMLNNAIYSKKIPFQTQNISKYPKNQKKTYLQKTISF